MNEAAILAARRNLKEISKEEISDALERIVAGPEKKGAVMTEAKKRLVAYHEVRPPLFHPNSPITHGMAHRSPLDCLVSCSCLIQGLVHVVSSWSPSQGNCLYMSGVNLTLNPWSSVRTAAQILESEGSAITMVPCAAKATADLCC